MAGRPIIFSGPMVRALLDGRKTQTRRVLKPQPPEWCYDDQSPGRSMLTPPGHIEFRGHYIDEDGVDLGPGAKFIKLPYAPGDHLWVREAHALLPRLAYRGSIGTGTIDQREHPTDGYTAAVFREGFDRAEKPRWRPSIHMPRWASRLTLVVTGVRVQRVQDISREDCAAEGCAGWVAHDLQDGTMPEDEFRTLWNSLHGPDAWDANPWVCALTFTVHRCNIDQMEG